MELELAALILGGQVTCCPAAGALLGEIAAREPDFYSHLLPVLCDLEWQRQLGETWKAGSGWADGADACHVSRVLLALACLGYGSHDGGRRRPDAVQEAARVMPWWVADQAQEIVLGSRRIVWCGWGG